MKAYKIDVTKREIYPIELDGSLEMIYKNMGDGVEVFCCPANFETGDTIYCDEEVLLGKEINGGFKFGDWDFPLLNNSLIIGCDLGTGNAKDVVLGIDEITQAITWFTADEVYNQIWKR